MGELWATKSGFPLLDALNSKALVSHGEQFSTYDSRLLDERLVAAVFYFAISIFWRAQVWDWGWERDGYARALGNVYEQEFRGFLLGLRDLQNVLLLVEVNTDLNTSSVVTFPTSGRSGKDRHHDFILLGMKFTMYVGKSISGLVRAPFEMHESQTMFISADLTKSPAFWSLAKTVQSQVVPKGKLARKYKR